MNYHEFRKGYSTDLIRFLRSEAEVYIEEPIPDLVLKESNNSYFL